MLEKRFSVEAWGLSGWQGWVGFVEGQNGEEAAGEQTRVRRGRARVGRGGSR